MKISGLKRWILLIMVSIFSGTMVVTPYLRFNYYDQLVVLFTQFRPISDPGAVNEYIGTLAMVFGSINMIMYIIGGLMVDKYGEKLMLLLGGLLMATGSVLFGMVMNRASLMIGFICFGFGTGTLFCGYLKLVRKLGTAAEQGRMYSTSECVRGVIGTCLGLVGVSILNQAILPNGTLEPQLIGEKWRIMLFLHAGIYILCTVVCFIMIPRNVIGAEENEEDTAEPFTLRGALTVLKMPGTWLASMVLFFGYSITACASGYLGAYTSNVVGATASQAATFAIIRNYFLAAISTLVIGYVALKLKSASKTIGLYSLISCVLIVIMLVTEASYTICIAVTFVFAFAYTGMRGLYFAVPSETKIPIQLAGITMGVMSFIGYLPDVFFAKLAGRWLDKYGLQGYHLIWYWAIGCAILGTIVCLMTYAYAKKLDKAKA